MKNALEIKEWCEKTYGDKKIRDRKLPKHGAEDEYENSLATKLGTIRKKIKKYEGRAIEEIEEKEDKKLVEIIRKLDEEYNYKKRKLVSKEIAQATISSLTDIEMSDREDKALKELVEKTREGGINLDEQS